MLLVLFKNRCAKETSDLSIALQVNLVKTQISCYYHPLGVLMTNEVVNKSKLDHERKMTEEKIFEVILFLNTNKSKLTRRHLVAYLRKKATEIHADIIAEGIISQRE
jgi:hypothetical protein